MNIYFAPLEGITGYVYRNAHADLFGGVEKYYAPFVSPTENICFRGKEIRDLLPENNSMKVNLVPQILTNKGKYFIKAAGQLIDLGYTKELNINLGCPSGTVVAKNKGSGFLRDLDGLQVFFEEIFSWRDNRENGPDISVKTRIGVHDAEEFKEILEIYNCFPISELTVHGRTRVQMYKDRPDWQSFLYGVNNSKNPIVYNGDINTVKDYKNMHEFCKVDDVMIGRGLIANPNLANEIRGRDSITREQIMEYHDRLYNDYGHIMKSEKHHLFKMKEFWNYVSQNFEQDHKCRKLVRKCQKICQYKSAVEEIFDGMDLKE